MTILRAQVCPTQRSKQQTDFKSTLSKEGLSDWDINDKLEQDVANGQWNEKNQVMPDDARKDLPGSQHAPELGRSLTFNIYARDVRHYKKRNLQQAGRLVVAFMREHPGLFVGVTLDPDTYLNPFFGEEQWYDYNPGTLKQFRHWLAGNDPAGTQTRQAYDLLSKGFGPGFNGPFLLAIELPAGGNHNADLAKPAVFHMRILRDCTVVGGED